MLIVIARIYLKNGKREEFIEKAQDIVEKSRKETGNLKYELLLNSESENKIVILENWESREDLNRHMESEHFKKFGDLVMDLFDKPLDISVYQSEKV